MKNGINKIISLSVLVIALAFGVIYSNLNNNINERASSDTKLFVSPTSQDLHINDNFTSQIGMDSGVNKVTGIDLVVTFDPKMLQVREVKPTTEIANFSSIIKNEIDNSTGKIRYVAFTFDKNLAVSGNLKVLNINGHIPQTAQIGSSEIKIDSTSLVSATGEGQNVLLEALSGTVKVVEKANEPNSCGGTCGSNFNCQSNLYCYQGYCRNPSCSDKTDCNCAAATTPPTPKTIVKTVTKTVVVTVVQTPTSAPKGGSFLDDSISQATVAPFIEPVSDETPIADEVVDTSSYQSKSNFVKYLIGMFFIILLIVAGILIWKNNKKNTPHILPPTNI